MPTEQLFLFVPGTTGEMEEITDNSDEIKCLRKGSSAILCSDPQDDIKVWPQSPLGLLEIFVCKLSATSSDLQ